MSLLKEEQLQAVSEAISQAEKATDAELVVVLARQADNYHYIPTLWAAVLALVTPAVFWVLDFWLEVVDVFIIQAVTFVIFTLILRIPFIMLRLIPKSVKNYRAANLARSQFLENNLHHTEQESGVLIFISEAEHYVEIIADRGINKHVEQAQWQGIVNTIVSNIKAGNTQEGMIEAISSCGELLAEYMPVTSEKNELPNHLVCIG